MSSPSRLRRSYLFAPGSSPRVLGKVLGAGADAVVLDLEDAVAPQNKVAARAAVADLVVREAAAAPCEVHVRVNRTAGGYDTDDVAAVVGPGLRALRLPKAADAGEIAAVAALLDRLERDAGLEPGTVALYPTIESAAGVERARELAAAPRVESLVFGAADFLADVGAGGDGRDATLFARSTIVLASRTAGIAQPVDGAYTDLDDLDGLRRTTAWARSLGFFGRSAIHPRQLAVLHDVATPTPAELAWAREVAAVSERGAAAVVAGGFVDAAVARRARAILALAPEEARR